MKLVLNTPEYCHLVDDAEIVFCEKTSGGSTLLLTDKQTIELDKTLGWLESQLTKSAIMRVHPNYLVNLQFLTSIQQVPNTHIILDAKYKIPVADEKMQELQEYIKQIRKI